MTNEQAIKKIQAIIDCDLRELNTMPQHEALQNEVEALDMAIKALEQQPSDDVKAIHTQGLAEGIRCAMCTNSMKSDKGCDGGCVVDNKMYKKVMDTIHNHIFEQPTSDDCVSRQAVIKQAKDYVSGTFLIPVNSVKVLSPVTPTTQRWIPVSERLPKVGEKVLCQCQANIYDVLKLTVDGWYYDKNHCYMSGFVIAWQPLPKPYKEKRGGEDGSN